MAHRTWQVTAIDFSEVAIARGRATPDDIVAEIPGLEIEKAKRVLRAVDDADRPAIEALVRARRPAA